MFVKKSWSDKGDTRHVSYHICRSYRDEEGTPRHEYLVNLTPLPEEMIEKIDQALSDDHPQEGLDSLQDVELDTADALSGAGTLSVYRAYRKTGMDNALSQLTDKQRESAFAMILSRILCPCSKLAIQKRLDGNLFSKGFSKNRLDEDELYKVMDHLEENFYSIQEKLAQERDTPKASLLLYDTTTTYFEGTHAEDGEYGKSKDHRWDRYQIVIGLVTDGEGRPLAVETWKGNTQDRSTVQDRIDRMVEQFGIEEATFISDEGTYSRVNLAYIKDNGYDYITSLEWHRQREKLESLNDPQRSLFDEVGVYEWTDQVTPEDPDGEEVPHRVRYVGVFSEPRQQRERKTRLNNMKKARDFLEHLKRTTGEGRYYTPDRLRNKINNRLDELNVSSLFEVNITPINSEQDPDQKQLFDVGYRLVLDNLRARRKREGRYLLQTSLSEQQASPEQVDEAYRRLHRVERGFREIKNFIRIRPVHHWKSERVRAHVLICFLAYVLVNWIEERFRENGIDEEVVPKLRYMDKLKLVETQLTTSDQTRTGYSWTLGEVGTGIKKELQELNWWRSIQAYKSSVTKQFE